MPTHDPFCKDCKHHSVRPNAGGMGGKPIRSDYICGAVFDLVTGEAMNPTCQNARHDQMQCGQKGRFFEPKPDADG